MTLEDLLALQDQAATSHVEKLAGVPGALPPSGHLPVSEVLKLAHLCDVASETIVDTGRFGFSKHASYLEDARLVKSYKSKARTKNFGATNSRKRSQPVKKSSVRYLYQLLKTAKKKSAEVTVAGSDDSSGPSLQAQAAPEEFTQSVGPSPGQQGSDKQASIDGLSPSMNPIAARTVLAKVAEQGCTCNGEGTCSYCKMKQAMAGKISTGDGEEAYNENGQEPDAATLAIKT